MDIKDVLSKHEQWCTTDGNEGERANLRGADLSGADLSGANLRGANLIDANLSYANLRGAYLSGADLSGANLRGANLIDANLRGAVLRGANLRGADLRGANLHCANLTDADLTDADLRGADLYGANLYGANLTDADLYGADLRNAVLSGAELGEVASLWGTIGNMREVKTVQCGTWPVTYTADLMQIGCQLHSLDEWWTFTDDEISRMDADALTWWSKWKPLLESIIEASPADTPVDPSEDESA